MAIIPAFQADDGGSIPLARSSLRRRLSAIALAKADFAIENARPPAMVGRPTGSHTIYQIGFSLYKPIFYVLVSGNTTHEQKI